ncbi:MAG: hypothetical protein J0H46_07135 [Bacteroidetes bacterium]|nr:hypothetical protein [Bacteroidota bacterium]
MSVKSTNSQANKFTKLSLLSQVNPQVNPVVDGKLICTGGGCELSGVYGDGGGNVQYYYASWGSDQTDTRFGTTAKFDLVISHGGCGPLVDY